MQHVDLGAALGRLAQALGDQRMVLAQEGADDQHAVQLGQVGYGHAEPRYARALAVAREIRMAQAEIGRAAKLASEIEIFKGRMRGREDAQTGFIY